MNKLAAVNKLDIKFNSLNLHPKKKQFEIQFNLNLLCQTLQRLHYRKQYG